MRVIAIVMCTGGIAAADPDPVTLTIQSTTLPVSVPTFTLQTTLFTEEIPTAVPSLRLEAARVAHEKYDGQWRYPEPGVLGGIDGNGIFFGHGFYRPRSGRAAALHAGSIGATMLGEILLGTGSPLAGVAVLAGAATMDAAAADSDRDAEAARKR